MIRSSLCLFLFSFSNLCISQIKTPVIKTADTITIKLENPVSVQQISKYIKSLRIIDLRDDTVSLGYCITKLPKKVNRITFDTSSDHVIRNWFSHYLKIDKENKTGDQLLVCVKKLRLSNEATLREFENADPGQPFNGWYEGVLIKIEFFMGRDEFYYPLYRFDSVIRREGKIPGDAPAFLATAFTAALSKLFTVEFDHIPATRRKLTLQEIVTRNSSGSAAPVLIETIYRKGVYKTFEEFKMNDPSIKDFEYKKGKMGDMLYVKEGDKEYPDRTAWGFCDGKNFFINSSDLFSELIRDGNTFYFKGVKSITKKAVHNPMKTSVLNLVTNTGEKRTVYKVDNKYYQVDMETGEVY